VEVTQATNTITRWVAHDTAELTHTTSSAGGCQASICTADYDSHFSHSRVARWSTG